MISSWWTGWFSCLSCFRIIKTPLSFKERTPSKSLKKHSVNKDKQAGTEKSNISVLNHHRLASTEQTSSLPIVGAKTKAWPDIDEDCPPCTTCQWWGESSCFNLTEMRTDFYFWPDRTVLRIWPDNDEDSPLFDLPVKTDLLWPDSNKDSLLLTWQWGGQSSWYVLTLMSPVFLRHDSDEDIPPGISLYPVVPLP